MTHGCLAVTVYSGHREQYTTFINKEATEALSAYHERRKKQGEILTPESLVFPSVNSKRSNVSVTEQTISFLIRRIKKTAGIGGTDDGNLLVHAFRRRFDTIFKLKDNANISLVERLMGHSVSVQLDNHYFQPTIENLFAEYQKGMMDLTIDDTERLLVEKQVMKEELNRLEEEKAKNRELESRMAIQEAQMKELFMLIQDGKASIIKSNDREIHVRLNHT